MFDPAGYVGTMYLSAPEAEVTPVPADVLPADQLVDVGVTLFSMLMPLIVLTIIWQVISYTIRAQSDVKVKTVYKTVEVPDKPAKEFQPDPKKEWMDLETRWRAVDEKFTELETNPMTMLTMPLILDPNVPQTAEFFERQVTARQYVNDGYPRKAKNRTKAVHCVNDTIDAFHTAVAHAEKVGLGNLSEGAKVRLRVAKKLLERASNPVNQHEFESDIRKLRDILYQVLPTLRSTVDKSLTTFAIEIENTHKYAIEN